MQHWAEKNVGEVAERVSCRVGVLIFLFCEHYLMRSVSLKICNTFHE